MYKKGSIEAKKIIESGQMSGYRGCLEGMYGGQKVQELEKAIAKEFNSKHVILCNSATSGLWAALAIKFNKPYNTDRVIVTPYSMTCSASLPLLFGCKPIFCDIESDFYCMDPKELFKKISKKTKAIIAVDLFGMPISQDIIDIAKEYKIMLIEDAAQAIGAKLGDKYCGTLGDIGILSFNQHKHIQAGEGGAILTDDDEYAEKLRYVCNHAEAISNESLKNISLIGLNLRMTEYTAAIILEQLKDLNKILDTYRKHPFNIPVRENCISSFYKYAWTNKQKQKSRPKDYNYKKHYITPLYKLPLFRRLGYQQNQCPTCEWVDENIELAWRKENDIS